MIILLSDWVSLAPFRLQMFLPWKPQWGNPKPQRCFSFSHVNVSCLYRQLREIANFCSCSHPLENRVKQFIWGQRSRSSGVSQTQGHLWASPAFTVCKNQTVCANCDNCSSFFGYLPRPAYLWGSFRARQQNPESLKILPSKLCCAVCAFPPSWMTEVFRRNSLESSHYSHPARAPRTSAPWARSWHSPKRTCGPCAWFAWVLSSGMQFMQVSGQWGRPPETESCRTELHTTERCQQWTLLSSHSEDDLRSALCSCDSCINLFRYFRE